MSVRPSYEQLSGFYRLHTPRPWQVHYFRPMSLSMSDMSAVDVAGGRLTFIPESHPDVNDPDRFIPLEDVPYRFMCQDCYAASGLKEAFVTSWDSLKNLRDGRPSPLQADEINAHARMHGIMLTWASGILKR